MEMFFDYMETRQSKKVPIYKLLCSIKSGIIYFF